MKVIQFNSVINSKPFTLVNHVLPSPDIDYKISVTTDSTKNKLLVENRVLQLFEEELKSQGLKEQQQSPTLYKRILQKIIQDG